MLQGPQDKGPSGTPQMEDQGCGYWGSGQEWGAHPVDILSALEEQQSHARGVGKKRKKEPKGRNQGCGSWEARGWPSACPPWCQSGAGGRRGRGEALETAVSPEAGEQERGLAGTDGWGWEEAVYLGLPRGLPGPLELQPDVRDVGAALGGVQRDPEDELHWQPPRGTCICCAPQTTSASDGRPLTGARLAPRPLKEGARRVPGVTAREAPQPRGRRGPGSGPGPAPAPCGEPQASALLPSSRTHPPPLRSPPSRAQPLSAAASATISSCRASPWGWLPLPQPFPRTTQKPLRRALPPRPLGREKVLRRLRDRDPAQEGEEGPGSL